MRNRYNPDVLSCLANLSNDEVFTPPSVVNKMLDMLPETLWSDSKATFLDPVSKTGIFLREIAKRLMHGLREEIPEEQTRANHILTKQLYGIAITELTSLLSRRSLYCSKFANGELSICTEFETEEGNISYDPTIRHTWQKGRCKYCGASQEVYDRKDNLESHAYNFIHTNSKNKIFKNMKFDVIIGNPPYQLQDGGDNEELKRGTAIPLYNLFIEKAKKLKPRYLTMIVPSRWFSGGRGLDDFRNNMLNDNSLRALIDYPISSDCFPQVEIKGGVCYFLWDRDYKGKCNVITMKGPDIVSKMKRTLLEPNCEIFIRYNEAISILRKVKTHKEDTIEKQISSRKPFGFASNYKDFMKKPFKNSIAIYANKTIGYISKDDIIQNIEWINKYKVYITTAYGAGEDFPHQIINKPFIGELNTCCTETYLVIGPYDKKETAQNVISYIKTRFFRFFVLFKKNTQNAAKGVYSFVPLQDFTQEWTDEKLYAKYGLTDEEIAFIESMIRPME